MSNDCILGGLPHPAPLPRDVLHVRTQKGRDPMYAILLNNHIHLAYLHWDKANGRNYPCLLQDCMCQERFTPRRLYGFIAAIEGPTHDLFCLLITDNLVRQFAEFKAREHRLRGAQMKLWREGGRKTGKQGYTFQSFWNRTNCPDGWDVQPNINKLYGCEVPTERYLYEEGKG